MPVRVRRLSRARLRRYRLRAADQAQLGRYLAHAFQLGRGLGGALSYRDGASPRLQRVLGLLSDLLNEGADFPDALVACRELLPAGSSRLLFCAHAAVGANMPDQAQEIVKSQSSHEESLRASQGAIAEACLYPALLYIVLLVCGALVITLLLPYVASSIGIAPELLRRSSQPLRLLMAALALPPLLSVALFAGYKVNRAVAPYAERLAMRIPVAGRLIRLQQAASLIVAFRIALLHGGSSNAALRLYRELTQSPLAREFATAAEKAIESGGEAIEVVGETAVVERWLLRELSTCLGEARSDSALMQLGSAVTYELECLLRRLKRFSEPLASGLIAVVLGAFLITVVRLMLSLYEHAF